MSFSKFLLLSISFLIVLLYGFDVGAANFQMQTGIYIGTAAARSITGVGFQPEMVVIKAVGTDGAGPTWKTTAMTAANRAYFVALADDASSEITFTSDGFDIDATSGYNVADTIYFWIAFRGSDCTSSGTFCAGSYTGNGTSQSLTSVGFQPDLVWVKTSNVTGPAAQEEEAVFKTSAMAGNISLPFINQHSTTTAITSLDATGFSVGADSTANKNTVTYWYAAFKTISGMMDVGSYTGNGSTTDDRIIDSSVDSGLTFKPSWVFVKNADQSVTGVFSIFEHQGDYSSLYTDTTSATDNIQALLDQGFQVGTSGSVNGDTNAIYYAAFCCAPDPPKGSGAFKMTTGAYTGNGTSQSITGLGFSPDVVFVKHTDLENADYGLIMRTSLHTGTDSVELAVVAVATTTAITSIDSDGFSVGVSPAVNFLNETYYWVALGNAYRQDKSSGGADLYLGMYSGSGIDNRKILTRIGFKPELVIVRRSISSTIGVWRASHMTGDTTDRFGVSASAADEIQALLDNGIEVGTLSQVNNLNSPYIWMAFARNPYVTTGSYTGNGSDNRDITGPGFQPDFMWTKKRTGGTARAGILRTRNIDLGAGTTTDLSLPFDATPAFSNGIQKFKSLAAEVGTDIRANENTFTYDWAAFKVQRTSVRLKGAVIRLRQIRLY